MAVRILLADDHAVFREGLRLLLESEPDLEVIGQAAEGAEAVRLAHELRPDIVLVDIAMDGLDGISATRRLRDNRASCRVIILSMFSSYEQISQARRAGADGYLVKDSAGKEVIEAIRAVLRGERALSQQVPVALLDDYIRRAEQGRGLSPIDRLSVREREVFGQVVEGRSSAEIAELLHLSPKTVDTYRSRLMKKLEAESIADLVKLAVRQGIVQLED